jgi:hypothetical protein
VFSIEILFSSTNLKKSLICSTLDVSLSYCFATDGSVLELISPCVRLEGILREVPTEKFRDCVKTIREVDRKLKDFVKEDNNRGVQMERVKVLDVDI